MPQHLFLPLVEGLANLLIGEIPSRLQRLPLLARVRGLPLPARLALLLLILPPIFLIILLIAVAVALALLAVGYLVVAVVRAFAGAG
jgi:hypothetical protein